MKWLLGEHGVGRDTAARTRKGDREKVRIACRLWADTPRTLKWIAGTLRRGAWAHVSNLLSARRGGRGEVPSVKGWE